MKLRKTYALVIAILLFSVFLTTSQGQTTSNTSLNSFGLINYPTPTPTPTPGAIFTTSFENGFSGIPNYYMSTGGGGTYWFETGFAHSGSQCLALRTPASTSSSLRSEFELNYLHQWSGIGDEIYVSVWLYLPSDWDLRRSGYNWYEIINTFVDWSQSSNGGYPRTCIHIHKPNGPDGPFNIQVEWANGAGQGDVLGEIQNFQVPRGEWFNVKYYVYRHVSNGIIKVWLTTSYYGTDYVLCDVSGIQTMLSSSGGNWFTVPAKTYLDGDGYEHVIYADDIEVWNHIP